MKNVKSNLDEMQEAKLLQIEHKGCWLAFWGLLAAMIVELFVFGVENLRDFIVAWIVFMVLCIYMTDACLRNGIWDRRLKADRKTNLTISLIAGAAAGLIFAAVSLVRYHSVPGAIASFALLFVFVGICCFLALSLTAREYRKKLAQLENDGEEDA